jgi:hypothetical protein
VYKAAISAHRQELDAELLELWILDGNCRQLRRSDKGEITWVETEHQPLPAIIGQPDILELVLVVGARLEIGRLLANTCHFHLDLLFFCLGFAL